MSLSGSPKVSPSGSSPSSSVAPSRAVERPAANWGGISLQGWLAIGIIAALMALTFRFNLVRLWYKTAPVIGESNWQHGFVVPIVGLYFLYLHKDELLKAGIHPVLVRGDWKMRFWTAGAIALMGLFMAFVVPAVAGPEQLGPLATYVKPGGFVLLAMAIMGLALNWGLATMIGGLALFAFGIYPGQNDYLKDLGMVMTLFGVVLTMCGWGVMRIAWFPIVFLICALPWPGLFYAWVASPLQVLAAKVAVWVLQISGVSEAFQSGTKIHMGNGRQPLNVAEACAGLKSLMTFITLGAALAFLSARPLWQKLFLVAMAVPVAIGCNVVRVSGQGLLDYYTNNPQWSQNFAHAFVGIVMVVPAFFVLLGIGWVLDQLFVDEADEETKRAVEKLSGRAKVTGDVLIAAPRSARVSPAPPRVAERAAEPAAAAQPSPAGASAAPGATVTGVVLPPRPNLKRGVEDRT